MFEPPAGWSTTRRPDGWTTLSQGGGGGVVIEISPLVGKSGFEPLRVMERDAPDPARVEHLQFLEGVLTRDGWPMKLVTYRYLSEADLVLETRLAAVYEIICYAAVAVARAPDAAVLEARREDVLAIYGTARPCFVGPEPVTIGDLWSWETP